MASIPGNSELKSDSLLDNECPKDLEESEPSSADKCKSSVVTANICGTNHTINICSPIGLSSSYKPGAGRSILKPSTLFTDANISSPSVTFGNHASKGVKLKPSVLANPFANSSSQISSNEVKLNCSVPTESITSSQTTESSNEDTKNSTQSTLVFVPLTNSSSNSSINHVTASSSTTTALVCPATPLPMSDTQPSTSSNPFSPTFVFGQNLHERVRIEKEKDEVQETGSSNGNTFSEMLFSSAIKQDKEKGTVSHEFSNGSSKTLSVSAKEYEEARSVKRKYEEVVVVTGEEDEQNILQINCKLFGFDNTISSWTERGRGTLRVNDKDTPEGRSSRLVMRLVGNLRVVLNTKIWGDMNVELVSQKSVRLTAIDSDGQVRIYLVTAQPKDADQLYNVLNTRIQKKKLKLSTSSSSSSEENPSQCVKSS